VSALFSPLSFASVSTCCRRTWPGILAGLSRVYFVDHILRPCICLKNFCFFIHVLAGKSLFRIICDIMPWWFWIWLWTEFSVEPCCKLVRDTFWVGFISPTFKCLSYDYTNFVWLVICLYWLAWTNLLSVSLVFLFQEQGQMGHISVLLVQKLVWCDWLCDTKLQFFEGQPVIKIFLWGVQGG